MQDKDFMLFDHYLLGELSTDEKQIFEDRLKTDLEFKNNFETYKELHSFIENRYTNESAALEFKNNLKEISEGYFDEKNIITKTKKKRSFFNIGQLAIAASIVILMGVFIFNQFKNPVYDDYISHDVISLTHRGNVNNKLFSKAEDAFNSSNYKEAEILFNQILMKDPSNMEVELYKCISLIETNQFIEADKLLLKISKTNSAYSDSAKWYLSLSKLKQKDFEACKESLKTIQNDSDYYKEAQELLSEL